MLLRIATFTLVSLFLSACARSPVVQLYDGPARSDSSIVTVRVPSELEVFTINGEEVEGVNTFFSTEYKDLKVAPGRYEILAYYKELWQLDAQRVHWIPNSVRVENFQPADGNASRRERLGIPRDAIVIGSVGHLRGEKNPVRLIEAVAAVGASGP